MASKKTKKKSEPKASKRLSVLQILLGSLMVCIGILYLSINIYGSQMIHPLYARLVTDDPQAWVPFFKVTRNNPVIAAEVARKLPEAEGKKSALQAEIDKDNSTRLEMIHSLEESLKLNPQSRDILYAIASLYKDSGDTIKAEEYLKRAQAVDPAVRL